MAQSRASRMKLVLTLAERQEKDAAAKVEEYRNLLLQEQQQLQQLNDYSQQYLQNYSARTPALAVHERINYSGFIQRLSTLIGEQESKVQRLTRLHEQSLTSWREKYLRRQSISQLIERLQQEENAQLDKRLQTELDELSSQQFNRRQRDDDAL